MKRSTAKLTVTRTTIRRLLPESRLGEVHGGAGPKTHTQGCAPTQGCPPPEDNTCPKPKGNLA